MDEYAEYLYKRRPHYKLIDAGDLTKQKAIRTKLQCKSFKWFMQNVAFDLPKKYPPVEPPDFAYGEVILNYTKLFLCCLQIVQFPITSPLGTCIQNFPFCK